jgi:cytochrome c-type biogenesis protein CcsB
MRRFAAVVGTCLLGLVIISTSSANDGFDWNLWRSLPVHNGGRQQPLDTLARETLRTIANRGSLADPVTKQRADPTALYLSLLFDWRGWEHPDRGHLELVTDWHPLYFHLHEPDKWDHAPLLRIDSPALRSALGLKKDENCITPHQLANTNLEDRRTERKLPFSTWARNMLTREEAGEELTEFENKGVELANRLWLYQDHRMGRGLEVLPVQSSEERKWMPVAQLLLAKFDSTTDPSGELLKSQQLFAETRMAFQRNDTAAFNQASEQLLAALQRLGTHRGNYPSPRAAALEVAYNQWTPFRFGWALMLVAAMGMWLHSASLWRSFYLGALAAYVAGLSAVAIGFGLRIAIAGRPPVTNMYESVIYVGAGVAVLGLVFELIYRQKTILTAAASVSTLVLVLADNCPLLLDPAVRPLEPVLRSNFWLVTHVLTITLSYAAFALALGIANITLGHYLIGSNNQRAIRSFSRLTYNAIQIGVLLLSAGIVLGGVWADYSWGRFWGWDPKEVWALVALLGYLAVLHARFTGWIGHRGLAALSVACFSVVVMAWYGVNFVLGVGLHSYGFGDGGQGYVYSAVALQLLYVGVALLRSWSSDAETPVESLSLITRWQEARSSWD